MGGSARPVVHAAGALVWRVHKRRLQVLLIHRPRYDDWSWPKGKLDAGEMLPACAVREVAEETGLAVVLGQRLPTVSYRLTSGATKVCTYWAAQEASPHASAVTARKKVKPSKHEVDETRWTDVTTALSMLSRRSDRAPLGALIDLWDEGRLDSWTVQLVRHGRARSRSAWKKGEESRPLTGGGHRQAQQLVPLISAFGAEEVVSSPWLRCHDTVAPYATAAGLDVVGAPQLTEAAVKGEPAGARALVTEMLRLRHPGVALCLHRPTLPLVLGAVGKRSPYRVQEALPESDPYLRTGEVLVAHVARPSGVRSRVVAVELHRP